MRPVNLTLAKSRDGEKFGDICQATCDMFAEGQQICYIIDLQRYKIKLREFPRITNILSD